MDRGGGEKRGTRSEVISVLRVIEAEKTETEEAARLSWYPLGNVEFRRDRERIMV